VSSVAAALHAVLKERKVPHHTVDFGKLALSAFAIGPLASGTSQQAVAALIAPVCSAAVPFLVKCEGKAIDKALVIVPSRYAAPTTIRYPKGASNNKQAYKNFYSQASSVDGKAAHTITSERHGIEAVANLYLARLCFPSHFQLKKLVRKRVCAQCLGTDHSQAKCKSKAICRNCCGDDCKQTCNYPALCGICAKAHRTIACPEYRGIFAEPTEEYTDMPARPAATGKAMDIEGIPRALQQAKYAQLLSLLTCQAERWAPEKAADAQVWGDEPAAPVTEPDTWRRLMPSTALLAVANTTRRIARVSGKGKPSYKTVIPPTATIARQWIEKVQQIEARQLELALAGESSHGCCDKTHIPALPQELQDCGITIDSAWDYQPPQQLARVDATPPRIVANGKRNRNAKGRADQDITTKVPAVTND
jgi:hypothetical protein